MEEYIFRSVATIKASDTTALVKNVAIMGVSVTDITRKKAVAIALCSGQLCELACLYTVYNAEKEGTEVESNGRAQSCNDRPSRWLKMMAKSFFLHGHWLFHSH